MNKSNTTEQHPNYFQHPTHKWLDNFDGETGAFLVVIVNYHFNIIISFILTFGVVGLLFVSVFCWVFILSGSFGVAIICSVEVLMAGLDSADALS